MDYDRINELLSRYWECETTLAEERELKEFFQSENVPDKWKKEAMLFQYFSEERSQGNLGEFFDHRILEEIHDVEGRNENESKGRTRRMWQDISKVAAVILVLVTAIFVARDEYMELGEDDPIVQSEAEAREAFEQTKAALLMLSNSMNKGTEHVGKMAIFNEAQDIVRDDVVSEPDSTQNK